MRAVGQPDMGAYLFRVWVQPNPAVGFDPDEAVWRDIEVDGSQTLEAFHDAIFDAFDRWEPHPYEFVSRDEDGIALRSYVAPEFYEGGQSWPSMAADELEQFVEKAVPDDAPDDAVERFRDLQQDPPDEADAADTSIGDLDFERVTSLSYTFDFGDNWEHHIELQETSEKPLEGSPRVVDEQGTAPPQYPDTDE